MPYNTGLEVLQWARESTPGTDLAATSKMLVNSWNAVPQSEFHRPPVVRGLVQRNRGFETPVKRWTQWNAAGPVSYEQLQHWLGGAVVHVASPTGSGPYVWTYTRNPAAIPTLSTYTFERQENDGATPINHAWHYGLVQGLTLSFVDGEPLMFEAEGAARRIQTETPTGSLSLPTPEIPPAPLGTLFIDATWANLGVTQVTSQILSARLAWRSGAVPIWTADGRTDLDYTLHGIDPAAVTLEADILCLLGAQYATEKAAAEAGTLRSVRLAFAGTSSRALQLNFLAKYAMPELFEFGEQDGQKVVRLLLQESTDGTNLFSAVLTNNVSAFA